jgi:hypothetical protein
LEDAGDANVSRVSSARVADRNQNAGGTVLTSVTNSVVMAEATPAPPLPWMSRRAAMVTSVSRSHRQTASRPPLVKAIFVATGRSSGAAFQMTMVYDGPISAELFDPGFVLEPVQNVTASQAEEELARITGRRVTVTIDAYCLQMQKPPPAAGMVYRLARNPVQQQNDHLAPIMAVSKALQADGRLHPDSDPAEYFHSIRQWALWTHEQGFKGEAAFAQAFIEHSKKNVTAAGRRWTPELEQAVRKLMPNRWRDISEVITLAGLGSGGGR